jgi:hypothetical protein
MTSHRPPKPGRHYRQLWRIVDGAVRDTLLQHPDYVTPKGKRSLRMSINKRVTGAVLGYAEQSARGRSGAVAAIPAAEGGPTLQSTSGLFARLMRKSVFARLWRAGGDTSARSSAGQA